MKKLIAVGTMVALMLAASSPAFAQAIATDESSATQNIQVFDASQFQAAGALQVNTGDANAFAADESTAEASIDQSLTIDQYQFNGGFGFFFLY